MTTPETQSSYGLYFTAKETEIFSVGQELECPQHHPKAGCVCHPMDLQLAALSLANLEKLPTFFLTNLPGLLTAQTLLSLKQEDDKT